MDVVGPVKRYEIWLVNLDPTQGSEIQKTRPCVVISPDEMNEWLRTIIVAPMTTTEKRYPTRVPITFQGKTGQVALDQIRTIDKRRLVKCLGTTDLATARKVSETLVEVFS